MIQNKIIKLKKYLFLISVLFFVLSLSHLVYTYVYSDSKMVPIQWGTVSEWLIWNLPSLNPLKPLSWNNQYIVGLLYRSLLKFDLKENKIVWDLATCDINNMLNVECYLKDNIFWSNWEAITADDVIATYDILKTSWVNKILSSLLEETTIEKRDNVIVFKNTKKDINFLNVFLQPILPKETIDSLSEDIINWNFPTEWQIYSWEFQISNITSDLTLWITKIEFDVNKYLYNWNISKLIINMFPNTNSMLQNKETINIFNDDDNIIWDSIPRLENHKYTLPQYVSLFINENKVKNINLRNNVLEKINTQNLVKLLWEDKYKVVNNPYLTETVISEKITDKNFEKIMSDMWYVKKSKIIEKYLPIITNTTNTWTKVEEKKTEVVEKKVETPIKVDPKDMTIDKFQVDSKYITEPAYVDKYNFITKDDVLLQWNAWSDIEEVYVNDYKLVSFKKWNPKFYYRLKESMGTIKWWVNTYKIYFVVWWKKELKEELTFVFYRNKWVLETETQKFIQSLYEKEQKATEVVQEKPVQTTVQKPVETTKQNTEQTAEQKAKLEQINKLDEKFYYNDKLEQFTLSLYYVSSDKSLEDSANFIKNSLLEIWVNIDLKPISLNDLRDLLSNKDKYDMILTWVNLGIFDYNIFPYFHSSQVKNGYNFSNLKKTSLDILLEDLKSEIKTPEETKKIQEKVLDILKKEEIVKTLYTPKINLLIDKNIKNIVYPEVLVNKSARKDIYNYLYTKDEKIINFENKWIWNFFNFLFKKLND